MLRVVDVLRPKEVLNLRVRSAKLLPRIVELIGEKEASPNLRREIDEIACEHRHPRGASCIRRLVQIEHDGKPVVGRVCEKVVLSVNNPHGGVQEVGVIGE